MRRLGLLLAAALTGGLSATSADAGELCESLFVPSEYGLACKPGEAPPEAAATAAVEPLNGVFAPLSRLTVHRLREAVADPEAWLQRRVTLDLDDLEGYVEDLVAGVDSPFRGTEIGDALVDLAGGIGALGRLPLKGCERSAPTVDGTAVEALRCRYELGPARQHVVVGLLEKGGETYAFEVRTMSEERLRHLLAVVNTFAAS